VDGQACYIPVPGSRLLTARVKQSECEARANQETALARCLACGWSKHEHDGCDAIAPECD
jgi:hypothetical protein